MPHTGSRAISPRCGTEERDARGAPPAVRRVNAGGTEEGAQTSSHRLKEERQDDELQKVEKKTSHKGSDGLSLGEDAWKIGFRGQ